MSHAPTRASPATGRCTRRPAQAEALAARRPPGGATRRRRRGGGAAVHGARRGRGACCTAARVGLAAQNMHSEAEGAFTGEVSPAMLRDAGCTHVILGHSERRQLFGETDEGVAQEGPGGARARPDADRLRRRDAGRARGRAHDGGGRAPGRARAARRSTADQVAALLLAYEPVWAIGTGRTATPEQAQEVHAFIRKHVSGSHGAPAAGAVRILYGGSVKPDNIGALMAQADVDGALVGGASLEAVSASSRSSTSRPTSPDSTGRRSRAINQGFGWRPRCRPGRGRPSP